MGVKSHVGGLVGKVGLLKHPPLQPPVEDVMHCNEANESFHEHLSSASMYSQVDWIVSVENYRGLFQPWLGQAGVSTHLVTFDQFSKMQMQMENTPNIARIAKLP